MVCHTSFIILLCLGTLGVTGATTLSSTLSVGGASSYAGVATFSSGTPSSSVTTGAVVVTGGSFALLSLYILCDTAYIILIIINIINNAINNN